MHFDLPGWKKEQNKNFQTCWPRSNVPYKGTTAYNNHALYLSVMVFSMKVLIGDTIFTSPTADGTAILRGYPNHVKD